MEAGRLDKQLQFQRPFEISDGAGNYTNGWQPEFTQAANIKFLRGGESVMASRLDAKQPAIVTIRASIQAKAITNDWRAVDPRGGVDEFGNPRVVYQIKELPRESDDRGFLEVMVMRGVPA